MAIYDAWASRKNITAINEYVGRRGRLFYDDTTGVIRVSDGVTPGGSPIPITLATETIAGGVKLGPGVTTNDQNQIIIDSTGLDFSFGDFQATVGLYTDQEPYAVLSSINANQDIIIASNGTGHVCVVGEFEVHPTNGDLTSTLEETPAFRVKSDGQVIMHVIQQDAQLGAVEIIGSGTGNVVAPGINGTMLHITGQIEDPCRVYIDGNGNYVSLVARRWNGTVENGRTAVLANDDVLRINATAQTNAGMGNVAMAQISIRALEDQTTTTQGSRIDFTVTPVGQPATNRVKVMDITAANGVSATKFTGPLTGNVTGTATVATNLTAATGILAGSLSVDAANIVKETASVQTFTLTGLTTNHKIVITSGTAMGYGVIISAAFVSAANTLSIEFQNFSNGTIDLPAKDIQYFAWI